MLNRKQLTYEDAIALRDVPHVVAVDPIAAVPLPNGHLGSFSIKYKGHKLSNTMLEGDSEQQPDGLRHRIWTRADSSLRRKSSVAPTSSYSATMPRKSFSARNPRSAKKSRSRATCSPLIGVLAKQKQVFGGGKNPNDNSAHFPLFTFRKIHPEILDYWISVKYDDAKNKVAVEDEIREMLRRRRRVKADQPDNFAIFTRMACFNSGTRLPADLFVFLVGVSSVGLMVGGVGVMNIMLVSVTERTREIGIRKALGATRRTIMLQFTLEAISLCAFGGVIGILLGAVLTLLLKLILGSVLPAQMSAIWAIVAFTVSCVIGLVFGIYPAWKASTLDPIDAFATNSGSSNPREEILALHQSKRGHLEEMWDKVR